MAGRLTWVSGRLVVTGVIVIANLIGVAAVVAIVYLVIPLPPQAAKVQNLDLAVAAAYVAVAVPLGAVLGTRRLLPLRTWLEEERPARPDEQRLMLIAPRWLFVVQMTLWLVAAVLFAALDAATSGRLAFAVGTAVVIGGLMTGCCAYLLTERAMRPTLARALAEGTPPRVRVFGVASRAVLAWGLGSGLPLLAVVTVGGLSLGGAPAGSHQLEVAMVVLGGIGLGVGVLSVGLAARATATPLNDVRRALEKVETGSLDTRVAVYDGAQLGQLQTGFNMMVRGLAERERIRAALNTYVDPDVAERIIEEDVDLTGEEVDVSILFLDIRGFTPFAEAAPAAEVVAALNHLFEAAVPVIQRHGGRVDKFVGDGLMAVFGAPRRLPDHATAAVRAARELAALSERNSAGLEFGIGVNSGPVLAGNLGGAGRLEFGVIGDVVNVAARVEAATRQTGDTVLLAEQTVEMAGCRNEVVERHGVTLKGKGEPVRVYALR